MSTLMIMAVVLAFTMLTAAAAPSGQLPATPKPDPAVGPVKPGPVTALPNLVISEVSFEPAKPIAGQQVIVKVVLHNKGQGIATFPAGSTIWQAQGGYGGIVGVTEAAAFSIGPNQKVTGQVVLYKAGEIKGSGSGAVHLLVDPGNRVAESDKTDNTYEASLTFTAPDMTIIELLPEPAQLTSQTDFRLKATVINQGNGLAFFPGGAVILGGPPFFETIVASPAGETFAPGEAKTYRMVPLRVNPGTFHVDVYVDPGAKVPGEGNYNNNFKSTQLVINRPPEANDADLVVSKVTFEPASPAINNDIYINVELKNQGTAPAVYPAGARLWQAAGDMPNVDTVASAGLTIQPGQIYASRVLFGRAGTLEVGSHKVVVRANPDRRAAERDYENNAFDTSLTINQSQKPQIQSGAVSANKPEITAVGTSAKGPQPDLAITSVSFTPASPTVAQDVLITVEAKNQGTAAAIFPAGANIWLAYKPGGTGVGLSKPAAYTVAPGQTFGAGVGLISAGELAAGTYSIIVKLDPDKRITDNKGSKSETTVNLSVAGGKPDLIISALTPDKTALDSETDFHVIATVKNQGVGPAYFPEGSQILGGSVDFAPVYAGVGGETIKPGESRNYQLAPQRVYPGDRTFYALVDPQSRVDETTKQNNYRRITLHIDAPASQTGGAVAADLLITGVSFAPAAPTVRDTIYIYLDGKNQGTAAATFPSGARLWEVRVVNGTVAELREAAAYTVGAGQALSARLLLARPGELGAGSHTVYVQLDPDNRVGETDNSNNQRSLTLTIAP